MGITKLRLMHGLYEIYYKKLHIKKGVYLFETYFGRNFSDSPRVLCEKLMESGRDAEFIVVVNDREKRRELSRRWMETYGKAVRFVSHGSTAYYHAWAVAEKVITNVGQDSWLVRKPGAYWLETWHGTPLKKLFFDIEGDSPALKASRREMKKQSAAWSALLADNEYSRDRFESCFGVDRDRIITLGYPRNDSLFKNNNEEYIESLRRKYKIPEGKKVALYAPTYRDDAADGPGRYHMDGIPDFASMSEKLGHQWFFLIRAHYYVTSSLNLKGCSNAAMDVGNVDDITDLYLLSDLLITDYSSVFFDYAELKRPMIFYAYDLDKYRDKLRGFYFDMISEVPGPVVTSEDQLTEEISSWDTLGERYRDKAAGFYKKFCSLDDGHASERVIERCGL